MPDRENVIESLNKALTRVEYGDMDNVTLSEVEEAIESAIALLREQEPVIVRCKDCRHYSTECCVDGCGWCYHRDFGTRDEWYCADGEAVTYADD